MTKGYTIYTLCAVYIRDDRLSYTLTDMWAIVVTFCCCTTQIFVKSTCAVEKVGSMLHVKIMEKMNISLSCQLIVWTLHVY